MFDGDPTKLEVNPPSSTFPTTSLIWSTNELTVPIRSRTSSCKGSDNASNVASCSMLSGDLLHASSQRTFSSSTARNCSRSDSIGIFARLPASMQELQKQSDNRKCSNGPAGTAVTS